MAEITLRVRAKGRALVPDVDAQDAGLKRFIGWEHKEVEPGVNGMPGKHAFVATGKVHAVPNRMEYRRDVKDGMLEAADEATAKLCGVEFRRTATVPPPSMPPAAHEAHDQFESAPPPAADLTKESV